MYLQPLCACLRGHPDNRTRMHTELTVLIADDESLARDRLTRMIESMEGFRVIAQAENGRHAIELSREHHPDLALLDIRMPDIDGIEAARVIADLEPPPAIIFCTAYDEYALKAFQANAVGYLLKPVRNEELAHALKQAKKLSQAHLKSLDELHQEEQNEESFIANTWNGQERLPLQDILLFRADHKYLSVIHKNGETLSNQTLKELEQQYENVFIRTHRSTLVNIRHIKKMLKSPESGYYLVLSEGQKIEVSRRHVSSVRDAFENK